MKGLFAVLVSLPALFRHTTTITTATIRSSPAVCRVPTPPPAPACIFWYEKLKFCDAPKTYVGSINPQARQHAGFSNSSTHSSTSSSFTAATATGAGSGSGGSNRPTGSTWGDVLMHVVSLPSSSSSSSTQPRNTKLSGAHGASANGGGGAWAPGTSEDLLRAERRRAAALSGSGVDVSGVLPPRVGRSMSRRADGAGDVVSGTLGRGGAREEGEGAKVGGLRRRRSISSEYSYYCAVSWALMFCFFLVDLCMQVGMYCVRIDATCVRVCVCVFPRHCTVVPCLLYIGLFLMPLLAAFF